MNRAARALLASMLFTFLLPGFFSAPRSARADTSSTPDATNSTLSAPASRTPLPGSSTATLDIVMPVQIATPQADGKLFHLVQAGQTLIMIARYYDVPVSQLYTLNNILPGNPTIYIGQKILIKLGPTATLTFTPSSTYPLATQTNIPAPTDTPAPPTLAPTETITPSPTPQSLFPRGGLFKNIDQRSFGMGIIAACILGLAFVGISSLLRRR